MAEQAEREALAAGGVVLRYGFFGGPGTWYFEDGAVGELVRKRRYPLVGEGAGVHSFIHVDDAAAATVAALEAPSGHLQRRRRPPRADARVAARVRRRARRPAAAARAGAAGEGAGPVDARLAGGARGREQRPGEGGAGLDTRPWVLADRVPRPVRFLHGARRATEAGQRMPAVLDVLRPRDQALELHRLQLPRALPVRRSAHRAPLHGLPAQGVRAPRSTSSCSSRRRESRSGFGVVKLAGAPRERCAFSIERAFPDLDDCVNRRFFDWPEAAPGAVRAFDLRDRL